MERGASEWVPGARQQRGVCLSQPQGEGRCDQGRQGGGGNFFFDDSTVLQAGAGQLVLAGSGCESTRETIEMTSAMAGRVKIKTSRDEKKYEKGRELHYVFCMSPSSI